MSSLMPMGSISSWLMRLVRGSIIELVDRMEYSVTISPVSR